ncbi:MAG: hypothetical protein PHH54_05915 [Candidatus Nanoarchaeia archaeon]|nr:hypothetical protein [Candidatus Nanoarchaeia archaeon]MDD5741490.1 hypothetical protein [Candidatus Nanoarchaeia archaeon]
MESNKNCPKCHGTGRVKEKNGTIHICFDCLNADVFEQHGNPKETNIKI